MPIFGRTKDYTRITLNEETLAVNDRSRFQRLAVATTLTGVQFAGQGIIRLVYSSECTFERHLEAHARISEGAARLTHMRMRL